MVFIVVTVAVVVLSLRTVVVVWVGVLHNKPYLYMLSSALVGGGRMRRK